MALRVSEARGNLSVNVCLEIHSDGVFIFCRAGCLICVNVLFMDGITGYSRGGRGENGGGGWPV
jgi:hypothetical protein